MNPNELRIGNHIIFEQTTHVISGIINKMVYSFWLKDIERKDLYSSVVYDYKPIPLTEKRLLEFGFISNPYQDTYSLDGIVLDCDKMKGGVSFYLQGYGTKVETVHHIQNIYQDLKQQELKFEP